MPRISGLQPPLLIWLLAPVTRGSGRCDDNVFTIALRTQVYGEMSYHKGHSNKWLINGPRKFYAEIGTMDLMDGFDSSMWVDDGMHGMGWFRLISSLFRTWFGPNSNQLASGACFAHSAQVWTCCKDWLRSFSNSAHMCFGPVSDLFQPYFESISDMEKIWPLVRAPVRKGSIQKH